MKWDTTYYCITIIAESDEDKELLKKLKESLPNKAGEYYDFGDLEFDENELTFNR